MSPAADAEARWRALVAEAARCRSCDLWAEATQTVFGEGAVPARIMLVGEQPGDQEDRSGRPFVGPAGRVLSEALEEAGVDRSTVYVTNAVKHFKWKPRGKRRIHDRPNRAESAACRPWLEQELALVRPAVLVALGATAAQSLLGSSFRLTRQQGQDLTGTGLAPHVVATTHPSLVLRAPDPDVREHTRRRMVQDLAVAAELARDRA
ncbi:MAG TPA: UdgX family uracil-DNA binding protein [Acidimicrobiales bacterium]|nr:UdgX family uracil-DNA binding protein [Acidimicrobiales bacterium]